jgi:hypothetical protein
MLRRPLIDVLVGLGVAWVLSGCEKQLPTNRYDVLTGTVQSLHADMGQLTVRITSLRPESDKNPYAHCLLSGDAEVYINDKFSTIGAIEVGDTAELIGYRDPNRAERFLVCLVHITRDEPLPPAPDLSMPATQPIAVLHREPGG